MNTDTRLDLLYSAWTGSRSPGGVAAVVRNRQTLYAKGFGAADLEAGTAFTPKSVFHICSVTKQFTALCILLMEQRGMLRLDDPVHRHLPELPDFGAPITVAQLVTNTSGLRDYMSLPFLADGARFSALSKQETTRLIMGQRSLQSPPGSRYSYSNTNFVLLGWIIERLTERLLGDIMRDWIFAPLEMSNTCFLSQSAPGPAGSVVGYMSDGKGNLVAPRLNVYEAGDGGIWSTLEDLIRWEKNFVSYRVGSPDLLRRLSTPAMLNDGTQSWYACGLGTGTHRGAFWQGHSGGLSGMSINRLHFPEHKLSVVAASNGPQLDTEALTFQMADIFLASAEPELSESDPIGLSDVAPGTFQTSDRGRTAVLRWESGTLSLEWLASAYRLTRRNGHSLQDETGMCSAVLSGAADARTMRLQLGRGSAVDLTERPSGAVTPEAMFCGQYRSEELDSVYRIEEANGTLSATICGPRHLSNTFALRRVADDVFYPLHNGKPVGAVMTFMAPGSMVLSASKAEKILFQRTSA